MSRNDVAPWGAERSSGNQGGFSLIEILVAVLILSIGILGVASTQVVSMQMNGQALMRTQAVLQANDLLDRMRANPANLDDYVLADGEAQGGNGGDCAPDFTPGGGASIAADDLAEWQNSLDCLLPDARRQVQVNGADPATVIVTIDWNQPAGSNPVVVETRI